MFFQIKEFMVCGLPWLWITSCLTSSPKEVQLQIYHIPLLLAHYKTMWLFQFSILVVCSLTFPPSSCSSFWSPLSFLGPKKRVLPQVGLEKTCGACPYYLLPLSSGTLNFELGNPPSLFLFLVAYLLQIYKEVTKLSLSGCILVLEVIVDITVYYIFLITVKHQEP